MPGNIPITLDRERRLRLDFEAIADADAVVAGGQVTNFVAGSSPTIDALRGLLWAGLKHEEPSLSMHRACVLAQAALDEHRMSVGDLIDKVREALKASGIYNTPEKKSAQQATTTENLSPSETGSPDAESSPSARSG